MKNLPLILCAGALLLTLGAVTRSPGVQSVQSADGNQSSSLDSSVNPYQSQVPRRISQRSSLKRSPAREKEHRW